MPKEGYRPPPRANLIETFDGASTDAWADAIGADADYKIVRIHVWVETDEIDIRFVNAGANSDDIRLNADEYAVFDLHADAVQIKSNQAGQAGTVRVLAAKREES